MSKFTKWAKDHIVFGGCLADDKKLQNIILDKVEKDLSKKQTGVEHGKTRDRVKAKQVLQRKGLKERRNDQAKYQRKVKRGTSNGQ
tara:strand:- start:88 stop:345 length:258 start_codon:yes stop_codon:yes gene_type:complete